MDGLICDLYCSSTDDFQESRGQQGDQTSQSYRKSTRIFIGRTDAEDPILWPLDVKSRLIGKDLDAGKDRGQEEKGMTEDEKVGWHHQLSGHEFEQIMGDSIGQGSLVGNSPWECSPYDLAH